MSWPRRHPGAVDSTIAVLAWIPFGPLLILGEPSVAAPQYGRPLALTLASLHVLPLAVRRSHPITAFTLISLGCLGQLLTMDAPMPSNLGFLVVAHALAAYGRVALARRAGLVVCVMSGILAGLDWYARDSPEETLPSGITLSVLAIVFWMWGDVTRRRREVLERLHEQNEALRRDRDQRARLAAQDERTRIAREMHDIVAHSLSVVVVQADGAAYVAEHSPDWDRAQAAATLATIGTTARQALAETRNLVGVLRSRDGGGDDAEGAQYAPTNTLASLTELVDRVRASGPAVRLAMDPALDEPGRLPTDTGLAAYRIVQESLTNVIKHAGPSATVDVSVHLTGAGLAIEVTDDGRGGAGATDDGFGHGLIGMRERAESVGGRFEAGPRPGGGFRVAALLPVPRAEPAEPAEPAGTRRPKLADLLDDQPARHER